MATALLPPGRGLVVRRGRVLPNATSTDGRLHPRQALAGAPLVVVGARYACGQAFRRGAGGGPVAGGSYLLVRPSPLAFLLGLRSGGCSPHPRMVLRGDQCTAHTYPSIRFLTMPCLFLSLSDHTTPGEERMAMACRHGDPVQSRQPVTQIQCVLCQMRV